MNKKIIASVMAFSCLLASFYGSAQTESKKEENIIIRKKGSNKEKMTIVIDGDKITINGKPVEEFRGENIDVISSDDVYTLVPPAAPGAPGIPRAARAPRAWQELSERDMWTSTGNRALLGVNTDKASEGAKITGLTKDGGAEKAGLKEGDIIMKIDDREINEATTLYEIIGKYKPEDKVKVTYKRGKKTETTTATLGKVKNHSYSYNGEDFDFNMPELNTYVTGFSRKPRMGMQIQDTDEGNGVKVIDVDDEALAAKAGLKEGDIIIEANGKPVKAIDDLRGELKDLKEGDVIKLKYKRGTQVQDVEVKFPKKLKKANL